MSHPNVPIKDLSPHGVNNKLDEKRDEFNYLIGKNKADFNFQIACFQDAILEIKKKNEQKDFEILQSLKEVNQRIKDLEKQRIADQLQHLQIRSDSHHTTKQSSLDKLHNKLNTVMSQNSEINGKFKAQSLQIQIMSDEIAKLKNINKFIDRATSQLRQQQTDDQKKLNKRINDLEMSVNSQQQKLLSFDANQELHANTIEQLLDEREMRKEEQRKTEENSKTSSPYDVKP
jgi:hypothetical protein